MVHIIVSLCRETVMYMCYLWNQNCVFQCIFIYNLMKINTDNYSAGLVYSVLFTIYSLILYL
jgi:hypothetical protein